LFDLTRSLLSKCVETHELGKLFTLASVGPSLFSMALRTLSNLLYEATLDSFPGAMHLLSGSVEFVSCFLTLILYVYVKKHERKFGPIGNDQYSHIVQGNETEVVKPNGDSVENS
jgi:hypothetical protein